MIFSPEILKTILAALGIHNLRIKFDCEKKIIQARFEQHDQLYQIQTSFQEIETAFRDSDSTSAAPSNLDVPTSTGEK